MTFQIVMFSSYYLQSPRMSSSTDVSLVRISHFLKASMATIGRLCNPPEQHTSDQINMIQEWVESHYIISVLPFEPNYGNFQTTKMNSGGDLLV